MATSIGRSAVALVCGLTVGGFTPGDHALARQAAGASTRVFRLRETAGIRRTEYPVSVTLQIPKGAMRDATHRRVMNNGAEIAAQFTARANWDDGSIQTLEVDLNASFDPEQQRRYELQFGPGITSSLPPPARGLTVSEQPDAVVVGNLRFSKRGRPLLASVSYRGEGIGTGANGLTITDGNGTRHDLSKAQNPNLDVVKAGPLLLGLRYTAQIPVDQAATIPVEITLDMPNGKSWLKTTATVSDRTRRVRDLALERGGLVLGM